MGNLSRVTMGIILISGVMLLMGCSSSGRYSTYSSTIYGGYGYHYYGYGYGRYHGRPYRPGRPNRPGLKPEHPIARPPGIRPPSNIGRPRPTRPAPRSRPRVSRGRR